MCDPKNPDTAATTDQFKTTASTVLSENTKTSHPAQNLCRQCGRPVTPDEIAVTKKLINRGTTTWFCVNCLAKAFDVTAEDIEKKIVYFKEIGCTLFS